MWMLSDFERLLGVDRVPEWVSPSSLLGIHRLLPNARTTDSFHKLAADFEIDIFDDTAYVTPAASPDISNFSARSRLVQRASAPYIHKRCTILLTQQGNLA